MMAHAPATQKCAETKSGLTAPLVWVLSSHRLVSNKSPANIANDWNSSVSFNLRRHVLHPAKRRLSGMLAFARRELPYLEMHLVDHCNLLCRGCAHFSSLAPPSFGDLAQFSADLRRLAELFRNVRRLRLMGGEPLLHPQAAEFIAVGRECFPKSNLRFVTNGTLLASAPARFWVVCRDARAVIDLTVYPSFEARRDEWRRLCARERVALNDSPPLNSFHAHMNLKGNTPPQRSFRSCRSRFYCPFLQAGRLHPCGLPALAHHFNAKFGANVSGDEGIDLHAPGLTARKILRRLDRPVPTCAWCSETPSPFPWARNGPGSPPRAADWNVPPLTAVDPHA